MAKTFSIALFLFFSVSLFSQVWVYNYPDTLVYTTNNLGQNFRSSEYSVKIIQKGIVYNSYVLADYNTYRNQGNTDWNHSTTFSFKGEVTVEIERKDKLPIQNCDIYPKQENISYKITSNKIHLTLNKPAKLYIEIEGMYHHPLFIFADDAEQNRPNITDDGVAVIKPGMLASEVRTAVTDKKNKIIYFEEGIHKYGNETNENYAGFLLPIISNKTYYIPGGAYIIATFNGTNASNVHFKGRGIISGCGLERRAQAESIKYNQIMFEKGGKNQFIEGLTFVNPTHFIFLSRGESHVSNVKMFGWWHQTDGWGSGSNSSFSSSFLKVNDDIVKVYQSKQKINNLVIYKQRNGAAFQLGWNSYGQAKNCDINNIYIVKDSDTKRKIPHNAAVINLVRNSGSTISNLTFKNIYIDNPIQGFLGIYVDGGIVENISIENVIQNGKSISPNYLHANPIPNFNKRIHIAGEIKNISIKGYEILGQPINEESKIILEKSGKVSQITFQ